MASPWRRLLPETSATWWPRCWATRLSCGTCNLDRRGWRPAHSLSRRPESRRVGSVSLPRGRPLGGQGVFAHVPALWSTLRVHGVYRHASSKPSSGWRCRFRGTPKGGRRPLLDAGTGQMPTRRLGAAARDAFVLIETSALSIWTPLQGERRRRRDENPASLRVSPGDLHGIPRRSAPSTGTTHSPGRTTATVAGDGPRGRAAGDRVRAASGALTAILTSRRRVLSPERRVEIRGG